ncbi:MAG: FGGY-family carbohydrate kinase [Arenicellales bacterium]
MGSFLGLDIGTSGVRATLINDAGQSLASSRSELPVSFYQQGMLCQRPEDWWQAVLGCLLQLSGQHRLADLQAISIDATSATTLLTNAQNKPVSPALMYNDVRPAELARELSGKAPAIPACSRTSALAKAVWLYRNYSPAGEYFIQQQADWVLAQFTGKPGISDWNNALKLGFDPETLSWPGWLAEIDMGKGQFPDVFPPGSPVAGISARIASQLGLPQSTQLHAGTTDSVAAFLASGAGQPGEAATSLGSTLVLKLCTGKPITSNALGIYSHRLDQQRWLAGGASNSGGAVLKAYFTIDELFSLSEQINPDLDTGLNYYPLPEKGERFPFPDPEKLPVMRPVPDSRAEYLQAIFEGIAQIERQGYDLLEELGASKVLSIRSSGGGAVNPVWTRIRQRIVDRPFLQAEQTEAAYGSALLAAGRL